MQVIQQGSKRMIDQNNQGIVKNGQIELWRFVFTIGIAIMHFGYFNGFYIGVDFFLMLTGYLTYHSIKRKQGKLTGFAFFTHKVKRLWTQYFLSFILMFGYKIFISNIPLDKTFVADSFLELSFLQILFPASNVFNGVTWYLSAIVIWMPLLIYLLIYHEKFFSSILAPFIALSVYGYLISNWGHVDFGFVWLGWINGGLLRAVGGLCAGVFLYYLSSHIYIQKHYNICSVLELLIGTAVVLWSIFVRQSRMDLVEIILLGVLIILSFKNDKGWFSKITSNRLCGYLGKISYSIYLNQLFFGGIVAMVCSQLALNEVCRVAIFLISLLSVSMFTNWIAGIIDKKVSTKCNIATCLCIFVLFWVIAIFVKGFSLDNQAVNTSSNLDSADIHCSIDWCNDTTVLGVNSYCIADTDEALVIEGWSEKISTMELTDSVFAICNGNTYDAQIGIERPDVVEVIGNEDLLYSGWAFEIPISEAKADEDGLIEIVVSKDIESKSFFFSVT